MNFAGKWDLRFLSLAKQVAGWSKDPSTQCGAVIVRPDKTIASVGFNGFARCMSDELELYEERDKKLSRVIHAEINAVLNARGPVIGYCLYTWPFCCCDRCAIHIIQAGIERVVFPNFVLDRWKESFQKAQEYFEEANVIVKVYEEGDVP